MERQNTALLESSIDFLKEKVKASDLARNNLENRMNLIQNKIIALTSSTPKAQKQNLTDFDLHLSNSHIFTTNLRKVDSNATANLRKMEEYFGGLIIESQSKFTQIEEKMLGMITQKEKILRNMNFQIQNQSHSIAAIEEWIKTDHRQVNSLHIVEQNLRQKVQLIQKNQEIKTDIIEQKMKYLEQAKEASHTTIKNLQNSREEMEDEMRSFKRQIKRSIEDFNDRVEENRNIRKDSGEQRNFNVEIFKMKEQFNQIFKTLSNHSTLLNQLKSSTEKTKKNILEMGQKQERFQSSNNYLKPAQQQLERRGRMNSSASLQPYQSKEEVPFLPQPKTQPKSAKKELPPKKNLFSEQILPNEEEVHQEQGEMDMRGGAFGLLRNLKKQKQENSRANNPLLGNSRAGSRKGLPPVREDSLTKKKKQGGMPRVQMMEEQPEEEMVCHIDEEGYLMDEEGNYIMDEDGNYARLSPQEIEQYVQQN